MSAKDTPIKVGQVLWLKIRLPYFGVFQERHPYLVLDIDTAESTVEIGQFHSVENKGYEAISETNTIIFSTNPDEAALPADSFLQLNNLIKIEYFDSLVSYRRTNECLSDAKLSKAIRKYKKYHQSHEILDDHVSYMTKDELIELNR